MNFSPCRFCYIYTTHCVFIKKDIKKENTSRSKCGLTYTVDHVMLIVTTITKALEAPLCVQAPLLTTSKETCVLTLVNICQKITGTNTFSNCSFT